MIVALPDICESLAKWGYLVSVPFIDNDSAVVRANVTFERGPQGNRGKHSPNQVRSPHKMW